MPLGGMTVGKDYNIGLYDANSSQIVDLGSVQDFRSTAQKHDLKNMPYNQLPTYAYISDGYSGSFTIVRTGPEIEDLHLQIQATFNNGGEITAGVINETIRERGGGVSRYQYVNVVFFLTDTGVVTRDNNMKQTIVWMASDKVKVSA